METAQVPPGNGSDVSSLEVEIISITHLKGFSLTVKLSWFTGVEDQVLMNRESSSQ